MSEKSAVYGPQITVHAVQMLWSELITKMMEIYADNMHTVPIPLLSAVAIFAPSTPRDDFNAFFNRPACLLSSDSIFLLILDNTL